MEQLENLKTNLVTNSLLELGDDISDEAKGKGRKFVSRFIEAGLAHYRNLGDVLITKKTLDKFIHTMVGCPVIITHTDITDNNVDKKRVGVVSDVWYDSNDGWYHCSGIIWDKKAIDLVKNQGWSVSCSYDFVSDNQPKKHNGKKIDREFTDGEFLHLALVDNPRYERANIVMNSNDNTKDDNQVENNGDWKEEEHPRDEKGRFTNAKKDDNYFNDKTGMSMYDDVLKNEHYAEVKQRFPKVIYMKPMDYIEKVSKGFNNAYKKYGNEQYIKTVDQLIESRKDASLEQLKKSFSKNKIDMPMIAYETYSDGSIIMSSQEGLHRAIIAKELGIEKMPVAIFSTARYGEKISNETLKANLEELTKGFKEKTEIVNNNDERKEQITMTALNDLENFIRGIVENACKKEEEKEEVENKETESEETKETETEEVKEEEKADKTEPVETEEEEETEEKDEEFEEEKETVENSEDFETVENASDENSIIDKTKEIVYNSNSNVKSLYVTRDERLKLGENY